MSPTASRLYPATGGNSISDPRGKIQVGLTPGASIDGSGLLFHRALRRRSWFSPCRKPGNFSRPCSSRFFRCIIQHVCQHRFAEAAIWPILTNIFAMPFSTPNNVVGHSSKRDRDLTCTGDCSARDENLMVTYSVCNPRRGFRNTMLAQSAAQSIVVTIASSRSL